MGRDLQGDRVSVTHTLAVSGKVLVRSVRVEVIEGPDSGKTIAAK